MRAWTVVAASGLALGFAACQGGTPRALTRLTCPATEGDLRRVSAAADGKSCAYRSVDGAEVQLRLTSVAGGVQATLDAVEREVRAMAVPPPPTAPTPEGGHEDVQIDMPGLHISTRGDAAKVKVGAIHVDAGEEGAVVRWTKDVRLRGEATATEKRGVRSLFILAGPDGADWPSVGYQAAGPRRGPLTVALVKWCSKDGGKLYEDVERLVRSNGGA